MIAIFLNWLKLKWYVIVTFAGIGFAIFMLVRQSGNMENLFNITKNSYEQQIKILQTSLAERDKKLKEMEENYAKEISQLEEKYNVKNAQLIATKKKTESEIIDKFPGNTITEELKKQFGM